MFFNKFSYVESLKIQVINNVLHVAMYVATKFVKMLIKKQEILNYKNLNISNNKIITAMVSWLIISQSQFSQFFQIKIIKH